MPFSAGLELLPEYDATPSIHSHIDPAGFCSLNFVLLEQFYFFFSLLNALSFDFPFFRNFPIDYPCIDK